MDIFRRVTSIFGETSVVLDNLRRLHREKTNLRAASEMFRDAMLSETESDRGQAKFLEKSNGNIQ